MKLFCIMLLLLCLVKNNSFAQIQFDQEKYDFGEIIEGKGTFKKGIYFTNLGKEPVIIARVSSSDGGFYTEWPKDPILPGQKGMIICVYNLQRIGPFTKSLYVIPNKGEPITCVVKGEVVHKSTTIGVKNVIQKMGEISFGSIDSVSFEIWNSGTENLYMSYFSTTDFPEDEILYRRMTLKNNQKVLDNYNIMVESKDTVILTIVYRNIYGNLGDFDKKFYLRYNAHDTLKLTVQGVYSGVPERSVIYEEGRSCHYNQQQLFKIIYHSSSGMINQVSLFSNGYRNYTAFYNWRKGILEREFWYEKGKLSKEIKHKVEY